MNCKQVNYGFNDGRYRMFPPVIQIALVSGICPSACSYCPMGMKNKGELPDGSIDELPEKFFDFDLFRKISDEIAQYPFAMLRIHSRGEPMCHPRYAEMITYAKKTGVSAVTSFTNGIYLKKYVNELLDAPIDLLEVSADAADENRYQEWRRNPYFSDVVEGVRIFVKERNKRKNPRTRCVVSAVDHPAFRPHKSEFIAFWEPLCDKVIVRPFHTYAGRIANPYNAGRIANPYNAERIANPYNNDSNAKNSIASEGHIPCVQLWERFSISPDGLVNACFNDWGDFDTVGDLRQENASIAGIWKNDIFAGIREASLRAPTLNCCKNCSGPSLSSWGKEGYQHWVRELLDKRIDTEGV